MTGKSALAEEPETRFGHSRTVQGVTIADVALAAAVSVRTVSRVLNGSSKVNAATREAVQAVIDRLGFSPSPRARALAVGRSYLIGMVHDDPNALVLDPVQRGIVQCCTERGYELVVHPAKYGAAGLERAIVDFANRSRVDGLILLPPISELAAIPAALLEIGVPVTGLASVRVPTYPAMLVADERGGARQMAEHLLALGHRRIAMITGPRSRHSATERAQGFRAALHQAGVPLPPTYVREGDYGFDSGFAAGSSLISSAEPPTAIFAGNDIMAAGVLKAAGALGRSVPRDLSVAGFDGSVIAAMVSPALTTVERPLLSMAYDATSVLLDMIDKDSTDWSADLAATLSLIARESTAAPPPA